jgi:hypothetical protein
LLFLLELADTLKEASPARQRFIMAPTKGTFPLMDRCGPTSRPAAPATTKGRGGVR